MGGRQRIKRKFKLSEVKCDLVGRKRKIRRKRSETMTTSQINAKRKPGNSCVQPRSNEGTLQTATRLTRI
jgi:hypothetical protein